MNPRSKRVLRILFRALRNRPRQLLLLGAWSLVEVLPTLVSGYAVARAVDEGFLAGSPWIGLAWLAPLALAVGAGALGTRRIYARLSEIVEPFRDDLVRHVVGGSLRSCARDGPDTAAVSRFTHQVEIVRDTFAGLVIIVRHFLFSAAGALIGLSALQPLMLALVAPPLALGLGLFFRSLGRLALRQRDYVLADERVAESANSAVEGLRDITAFGAEQHVDAEIGRHVDAHAAAERALARMTALRALALALGGWLPVLLILASSPWLLARGVTAGVIMGALTYLIQGLKPALQALIQGLGSGGLRLFVTLDRLAETGDVTARDDAGTAAVPPSDGPSSDGQPSDGQPSTGPGPTSRAGHRVTARSVRFRYGRHAEPVIDDLDLDVPEGDHLAIVGPSGIGKSTLANLLAGTSAPQGGSVQVGRDEIAELDVEERARRRALIPQQAYVFRGTVSDNLRYLNPAATDPDVDYAAEALGLQQLLDRLGGLSATLEPGALSAGERQAVALLRTYLSPAPLVLLDEGTCHLDPVSEERVERAFAERPGTLVVIAHRMSSALRAKRVLLMDGRDVHLGTHEQLFETTALYRSLVGHWDGERQAGSAPDAAPTG